MTVYELIRNHEQNHPRSHFFDKDTLRFFGERISEMRVLKDTAIINRNGEEHECYVLSSLQHNSPCKNNRVYHYFDTTTFDYIIF